MASPPYLDDPNGEPDRDLFFTEGDTPLGKKEVAGLWLVKTYPKTFPPEFITLPVEIHMNHPIPPAESELDLEVDQAPTRAFVYGDKPLDKSPTVRTVLDLHGHIADAIITDSTHVMDGTALFI